MFCKNEKFTDKQVLKIRVAFRDKPSGITFKAMETEFAKEHNVSVATIKAIRNFRTYSHVLMRD